MAVAPSDAMKIKVIDGMSLALNYCIVWADV